MQFNYLFVKDLIAKANFCNVFESGKSEIDDGIVTSLRDTPPAHYTLKLEGFSALQSSNIGNYESSIFTASGYKWKLKVFPKGNTDRGVRDHLSLYLLIAETNNLPRGWEINVQFKFFVFDHIHDKFLILQDTSDQTKRFHKSRTELGFDKLIPLKMLKDASKGYLLGDSCVFGVEVFVVNSHAASECLSTLKIPESSIFSWTVKSFSTKKKGCIYSNDFKVGDYKWKLKLYPNGNGEGKGKSLSVYLDCAKTLQPDKELHVEYVLLIRDQVDCLPYGVKANSKFTASNTSWGFSNFLSLEDLTGKSKGFMVQKTIILECRIIQISSTRIIESAILC